MNILFLCRQKDLGFGQVSLARALERRGVCVTCVEDDTEPDEDITKLLARHTERPSLILQPELDLPLLPQGLADIDIPTACLHIDTYAYTERRIRWSMLFDHPIVYHPGYRARSRSITRHVGTSSINRRWIAYSTSLRWGARTTVSKVLDAAS